MHNIVYGVKLAKLIFKISFAWPKLESWSVGRIGKLGRSSMSRAKASRESEERGTSDRSVNDKPIVPRQAVDLQRYIRLLV